MRYKTKKTGHEKTTMVELLETTNKEIPYEKDKERDNQSNMKEELEQRYPFQDIKRQIDNMNKQINDLKDVVGKLTKHTHADGKVVIDVKEASRSGYF